MLAQLAAIPELQIAIAANPTTPEDVLDWLLERGSSETRAALGEDVRPTDLPPGNPRRSGVEADDLWAQEQAYRREREAKAAEAQAERERQAAERAATRDGKELADRAGEIRRWEAAWVLAHDGQAPPPGFVPPVAAMSRAGYGAKSMNSMAVVAFVSAFFIAILGLILGNIALRQIRDSGEGGHGLALAAVIIAWVQIGLGIVMLILFLSVFGAALG